MIMFNIRKTTYRLHYMVNAVVFQSRPFRNGIYSYVEVYGICNKSVLVRLPLLVCKWMDRTCIWIPFGMLQLDMGDKHLSSYNCVEYLPGPNNFALQEFSTSFCSILCFAVVRHWHILPISFRVTSLVYDCPSAREAILKDMGKFIKWMQ